jgi:glycyl-tRNA synthetase beta chain
VAAAIEEHYWPRHAGDRLPSGTCGRCLALADRLDTLVGIFAIGQRPTGVKDPYALRRAAIGVLRILIETPLALDLRRLLAHAAEQYQGIVKAGDAVDDVLAYCTERLKGYYADTEAGQAADGDVTAAVLSLGLTEPADLDRRIRAVQGFRHRPEAEALAAANKRTRNLLRKADPAEIGATVRADLLRTDSERALALRLDELRATLAPLLAAGDYDAALAALASVRDELDRFFDEVMVMDEDPALRANRLAILESLQRLFLGVADISLLQPKA